MATIHWQTRSILAQLSVSARLPVLMCYILHKDAHNQSWPSLSTIQKETGKARTTVTQSKAWLLEHGLLERIPQEKRTLKAQNLTPDIDVMRVTGHALIEGIQTPYLFGDYAAVNGTGEDEKTERVVQKLNGGSSNFELGGSSNFEPEVSTILEGNKYFAASENPTLHNAPPNDTPNTTVTPSQSQDNATVAPPPQAKPKQTKQPKPLTPLQQAVKDKIFSGSSAKGFLQGRISHLLAVRGYTPDELTAFIEWYHDEYRGVHFPHDIEKFTYHLDMYEQATCSVAEVKAKADCPHCGGTGFITSSVNGTLVTRKCKCVKEA